MASSSHLSQEIYPASYAAFFAPRTHKFETVDFRVPATEENLFSYFPSSSTERTKRARIAGLLGIAIGFVFALIGFGVDQLTRGLTIALYRATERVIEQASFGPAAVLHIFISVLFVAVAVCLVLYVAPLGAGSGIPELKSYLNGVRVPGFLAINSLFVKALGIAFSIASGLICGKQGPMIHAGAIIGAGMTQAASSRFRWRLTSKRLEFLRTEAWKRDFAAVGAAVGVAVAFGAPMGAWMWVYEEACTHWSWELGIITLGGCLTGTIVARILNYLAMAMPGGGFGLFTLTQFGKLVTPFKGTSFLFRDTLAYVALGVIGGLCGAVLPLVNKYITLFRYKRVTRRSLRIVEALAIGILTAAIRIMVPYAVNDCIEVNQELNEALSIAPLEDWSRFTCPENQFSPWAAIIYNPTDTVVRGLLFASGNDSDSVLFPSGALAFAFVYYFVFMTWTYGIAVPAGIFFPGFLLGSVYGRLVGNAVQTIFPDRTDVSLTGYAFIGAVSALAGITRTISVAVIALEATGGNGASFAAVFAALIAKFVGDFWYSSGIYDLHIDLKGIPFLRNGVPELEKYQKVRVSDVMENKVVGVKRLSRISGLVHMLGTNDHHAFPVFSRVSPNRRARFDQYDQSVTSALEDKLEGGDEALRQLTSRIITPSRSGMQATIFDEVEGITQLFHISERGEVRKVKEVSSHSSQIPHNCDTEGSNQLTQPSAKPGSDEEQDAAEIPEFEMMGTIDRGTLLAVLEEECAQEDSSDSEKDVRVASVRRVQLDSAWPNVSRLKDEGEANVIKQVSELDLGERVVDLRRYIDPDPLLLSDRALSVTAYELFRKTGARHILVNNMRSGRVAGIMTRKDILLESIEEVLSKRKVLGAVKTL